MTTVPTLTGIAAAAPDTYELTPAIVDSVIQGDIAAATGPQAAAIAALNTSIGTLVAAENALALQVATPVSATLLGTDTTGHFVAHPADSTLFSLTATGVFTANAAGFKALLADAGSSTGTTGTANAAAPAIILSAPNDATSGTAYTVTGTLTGYSTAPTLTASLDAGTFSALPSGSAFSVSTLMLALPSTVAAGTHTAQVRDSSGVTSNAVTYTVAAASSTGTTAATSSPAIAIPAFGSAPASAAAPPTIYQTASATNVNSDSSLATSLTVTLATLTSGSNVAVLVNGTDGTANAAKATLSVLGLTKVCDLSYANGWIAAWFGPSSALGGLSASLGALTGLVDLALVETSAASFDVTWGALGGVGTTNKLYTPTAADVASARSLLLVRSSDAGSFTPPAGMLIKALPGITYNGGPHHDGALIGLSVGSTAAVTLVTETSVTGPGVTTMALTANFYAGALAGGGNTAGTQVVVGGAAPMPAVIPPPAGGYAPYHARDLAAVAQGKQPRFTLGMFGASYVQGWRRLALATYAIGFAQARLDFTSYDNPSVVYGSTQYAGRKNAGQGVTDKLLCISFMPWSSSTCSADVAAGNYDSFFQGLADDLIANGSARVRLRITWELNEQYYYSVDIHNCPDQFVAAIRRVVWLMTSRPGAQFTVDGPAPILVAGGDSNGDPTQYLTGADATGDLSSDNYDDAFADNQGPVTAATPARIASLKAALQNSATGSTSWQATHAKAYGVPMGYGEGASCGTRRNDGHGIGDIPELMTAYADECLITDPVSYLFWWMDNGGGTDSIVTPVTGWPNSSDFFATYEVFKARFGTPQADPDVANGAVPQAPGLTATFSNGVLTLATTKASGDTVNYTVKQVAIPGQHIWTTWNDVLAGDTVASNGMDADVDNSPILPPGFVAGGLLDCRVFNSNTLGNSPWTQVRINTATGAQVGSTVNYPSTYGLNEDGTCGPTLLANEIPPTGTIGAGSATTAAVSVQKATAVFASGVTSETVTLAKSATAGNHVVLAYIGASGNLACLNTPSGFTLLVSRTLGVDQAGMLWFGPVSALTNNGVTLTGTATADQGLLILEETTGSAIEFAGQNGSYGRDSFSVNGMMTASQGGGAQSMAVAWDTAGAAVSTNVGTIDFTASGLNYGGFIYHSFASLTIPSGTHGLVNVGTVYNSGAPLTPEKPGYLCWTTYTSAPPAAVQPTLASFSAATGVVASVPYGGATTSSSGTTASTGGTVTGSPTSTPTSATPALAQPVAHASLLPQPTVVALANAPTAGNYALFFSGAQDHDPGMPSGWAELAGGVTSPYHVTAWQAPVSALTSNGVTLSDNLYGFGYLAETTGKAFDASFISGNASNAPSFTFVVPAAAKSGAEQFALASGYLSSDSTFSATGATILASDFFGGGGPFSVLLSVPTGGGSVTVSASGPNITSVGVVCVNAYSS